jgi:hypothetical protein
LPKFSKWGPSKLSLNPLPLTPKELSVTKIELSICTIGTSSQPPILHQKF